MRSAITLEVHTPISATPKFLRQWHYQIRSFDNHAGSIGKNAVFHAWISRDTPKRDLRCEYPWLDSPRVVLHWLDEDFFRHYGYYGTGIARGACTFRSDWVIFSDADVIVSGELDSLISDLARREAVGGVPAHLDCFGGDASAWPRLFDAADIADPVMDSAPSAPFWHQEAAAMPSYWNFGFVIGPREPMTRLGSGLLSEMEQVRNFWGSVFQCQQAVTLAVQRQGIPHIDLPVRYNFPNYPEFVQHYPEEWQEARVIHYLGRSEEFSKDKDFDSEESIAYLLGRKLDNPVNRRVQELLGELSGRRLRREHASLWSRFRATVSHRR